MYSIICKVLRYYSRYGVSGVLRRIKERLRSRGSLMKFSHNDLDYPFFLRAGTSDIGIYEQVFFDREYEFLVTHPPKVILDAGANIGLAAIYFANKYPEAKIIAIEPEESNFELLKENVSPYANITPIQAALWNRNEDISLIDPGLDKCGFMTQLEDTGEESRSSDILIQESRISECHQISGMTIDGIMKDFNLSSIDILKIDIEGAEKEVFENTEAWIESVNAIIIELHEHMKSGCNRSFYNGSNGFDYEWVQGENVYLSRNKYLMKSNG